MLPGAYLGPLTSAFVVTAVSDGRPGLQRWAGRLVRWRIGLHWYALALLGVPAMLVLGTLPLPGAVSGLHLPSTQVMLVYLPALALQVVTTGVAEEPGWRDFALSRLQRRFGPLVANLILGPLWGGWHLPLFLVPDWGQGVGPIEVAEFLLLSVVLSVVITWAFNRSGESVPLVILIHATMNNVFSIAWSEMFPTLTNRDSLTAPVITFGALAILLVVATRGRLGYDAEPPATRGTGLAAPSSYSLELAPGTESRR
jgi:membrane protease YdiL (CAAX protease family)